MKIHAVQRLRERLASGEPACGVWVTLEAPSVSEMAVAVGVDWIVVDAEHGHLEWGDIAGHVRSAVRSDVVVLVRIAELNAGLIKRVLDIGAEGVIVPAIETADELRRAVSYCRYPPEGVRGIGAERATEWGRRMHEAVAEANAHVLTVPLVETVTGGRNIEALCDVPGVELFLLGPADYSASAGYAGQWEAPGVAEQLVAICSTIRQRGKSCGIMAGSADDLARRRHEGFNVLGLGMDSGLFLRALGEMMRAAGREPSI
jgi:2-dehydro-3-deoxyglucarate aldolase/4-hydroxy-2-oxoheptanedioate aldolase